MSQVLNKILDREINHMQERLVCLDEFISEAKDHLYSLKNERENIIKSINELKEHIK